MQMHDVMMWFLDFLGLFEKKNEFKHLLREIFGSFLSQIFRGQQFFLPQKSLEPPAFVSKFGVETTFLVETVPSQ